MSIAAKRWQAVVALGALVAASKERLSPRAKLKVARLIKALAPMQDEVQQAREAALDRYAQRGEGDVPLPVLPNGQPPLRDPIAFAKELRDVVDEVQSFTVEPLLLADLADPKRPGDYVLSAEDLAALGPFLADLD